MLRVGVIGVGHLGVHHARILAGMDGVTLAGVHDIDVSRCAEVAGAQATRAFDSIDALLDVVDAVSIAVPTAEHRPVAEQALIRRLPTLVEKPIAASLEDATAMVEVAERHDTILMVGHVERWNGAFRSIVGSLERPRFIESHRLASFPGRGLDVDVIQDLMIHDLDLVLSIAPAPLARVEAVGVSVLTDSADIANARLQFEDGMVANLTASRASREPIRKMRIFQDHAYVSCDFMTRSAEIYERPPRAGTAAAPTAMSILASIRHQKFGPVDDPDPLTAELQHFVDCARRGTAPECGGEHGLAALRLAQTVSDSMAEAARKMGVPMAADGAALPHGSPLS